MKFFVAFAAFVAVAVAVPLRKPVDVDLAQYEAIIAAINSPNTDPATAALLEEQLHQIIAAINPIAVGPAIIPAEPEPVEVGPVILPHPILVAPEHDGGAVTAPAAPVVSPPVVVGEIPAGTSPLVQIIVNVATAEASPIAVGPAILPEIAPSPVHVVETAPEPVQVVEVAPEPVQVVEVAPAPVEPVQIGVPVLPEAAVVLPEELN